MENVICDAKRAVLLVFGRGTAFSSRKKEYIADGEASSESRNQAMLPLHSLQHTERNELAESSVAILNHIWYN